MARFDDIQLTVPQVLRLVSESLPLRSAVLLLDEQHLRVPQSRAISWQTEGETPARLRYAKAQASAAYDYLSPSGLPLHEEPGAANLPSTLPPPPNSDDSRFVLLPLVVDHGRIFGALQIESGSPLDEADLLFVNATVGQLAIALNRKAVIDAKLAADREGSAIAQFLAEASLTILSSLDYEKTISAIVHSAVPFPADICCFDDIHDDGSIERIACSFADAAKRTLAADLQHFARANWPGTPPAEALRTGRSVLVTRPSTLDLGMRGNDVVGKLGVRSMMSVPLFGRSQTLGALTFLRTQNGAPFGISDLHIAEQIGLRAAIAIDNARLYAKARQAADAKGRAVEARETLLAVVAHDLRNPLATISISADLLLRSAISPDRSVDRKVGEKIKRATERMNHLIGDLVDIASLEAGHLKVDLKPHAVSPLVEEAAEAHESKSLAKGLHLRREVPTELLICCDRERILEVLGNLLENAIKFTPPGGSIRIRAVARGDEALFSVSDTGRGIAPDELSYVFDRYWQARKTSRIGAGLGLSIAKGLVETHRGKLWVESQLGKGSTFFFTLPFPNGPALLRG
ncbi:MAG: ATP-binding protein [Polyangiaceae bacterium]